MHSVSAHRKTCAYASKQRTVNDYAVGFSSSDAKTCFLALHTSSNVGCATVSITTDAAVLYS